LHLPCYLCLAFIHFTVALDSCVSLCQAPAHMSVPK
jgi:hypothetical protein